MSPPTTPSTRAFDPDERVMLHPLVYLHEGDDVTIGRPGSDAYVMLGTDAAAVLRRLEAGDTPEAVSSWYEAEYRERIDIGDFVGTLGELGFVRAPDEAPATAPVIRWQRLGGALFSAPAWILYGAILAWAAVTVARHPDLAPSYRNVFFTDYYALIELVFFVTAVPLLLLHEGFHALAARRLGIPTRLSIGNRMLYVVLETEMDGLVTVPRRRRYVPILAGLLADLVVVAALTLAAHVTRDPGGAISLGGRICLAVALAVCLRIAWQFFLYLRTDIYVLICTALGCNDLHATATQLIRNRFNRLRRRRDRLVDEAGWHPADRKAARWYAWLVAAGYAVSISTFVAVGLPVLVQVTNGVAGRFSGDHDISWAELLDSMVLLGVIVLELGVLAWVVIRDRRRDRQRLHHIVGA